MSVVVETSLGDVTVDLFLKERPRASLNFLKLCKIKYYNYNLFHTVSRGFIAQTGDPTGSRTGGESIYGVLDGPSKRYVEAETNPRIKHTKMGLISFVCNEDHMMSSQFFFTLGEDLTYLDEKHCVFGEVMEGLDVLEAINEAICCNDERPYQDIRITHTVILDDPLPDPCKLRAPSRSPSPSAERLQNGRIPADEEIDETAGKSSKEVNELIAEREAKARATILEMVGDIPDAEMAPPENVLFVCKLNPVTTDDDLEIIFSRFGKIKSCEVIRDHKTGDSLQYAFIEFEEQKSCEDAYFKMDNVLIDDRRIHVDFSQSVSKLKWHGKGRGVTHYDDKGRKVKDNDQKSLRNRKNMENGNGRDGTRRNTSRETYDKHESYTKEGKYVKKRKSSPLESQSNSKLREYIKNSRDRSISRSPTAKNISKDVSSFSKKRSPSIEYSNNKKRSRSRSPRDTNRITKKENSSDRYSERHSQNRSRTSDKYEENKRGRSSKDKHRNDKYNSRDQFERDSKRREAPKDERYRYKQNHRSEDVAGSSGRNSSRYRDGKDYVEDKYRDIDKYPSAYSKKSSYESRSLYESEGSNDWKMHQYKSQYSSKNRSSSKDYDQKYNEKIDSKSRIYAEAEDGYRRSKTKEFGKDSGRMRYGNEDGYEKMTTIKKKSLKKLGSLSSSQKKNKKNRKKSSSEDSDSEEERKYKKQKTKKRSHSSSSSDSEDDNEGKNKYRKVAAERKDKETRIEKKKGKSANYNDESENEVAKKKEKVTKDRHSDVKKRTRSCRKRKPKDSSSSSTSSESTSSDSTSSDSTSSDSTSSDSSSESEQERTTKSKKCKKQKQQSSSSSDSSS